MRLIATAATLASTVLLAGCITAAEIDTKIAQVQSYTTTACRFVPTVATIAKLFSIDAGATIAGIGGAICNALTTAPLADGPGKGGAYVNGVRIEGKDLRTGRTIK